MGLWQACPETDFPCVLLSQILFLISRYYNPQSPTGFQRRYSRRTKKLGPVSVCVCVSLCPMLPVANVCHVSLLGTTVTFSLSLHHQLLNTPQSPYLLDCMWIWNTNTMFSSCWVVTNGFWKFILSFIHFCLLFLNFSFVYWASTGDWHSFASLWDDVLYRQKHQKSPYFLQFSQMLTQFWSILQRQASSCTTVIAALFSCLWLE